LITSSDQHTQAPYPGAERPMSHGVVQLIIQDGRIVQIDKTEKIRLA
jgi:hypothetical protein